MDERLLTEQLIAYDTSNPEGLRTAAAFVKGWLEARDLPVEEIDHDGLPVLIAQTGPAQAPCVILHGHLDVVPGHPEQFQARPEEDRLFGRGAYDMKGALGAMMCALRDAAEQQRLRVLLVCVPDEESEDVVERSTEKLLADGLRANFAITGEPTDMHIGVQAKGVLAVSMELRGTAAHGSTPWLGDNAILKAHDAYRRIETLPFSRQSSELFDRPSINLARINGGDAFNKVPDRCQIEVDIRYLPEQDPEAILEQIRAIPDLEIQRCFIHAPANVSTSDPGVVALGDAVARHVQGEVLSVGRDGASDALSFLKAGIPAVEFGPTGAGHHGPHEWVSVSSLASYRQALGDFIKGLPGHITQDQAQPPPIGGQPEG
jgi:succinyl-diaminopimelate desuccinylase